MKTLVVFDRTDSPVMTTSISADVEWDNEVVQELVLALQRRGYSWALVPEVVLTTLDTMLDDAKDAQGL